MPFSCLIIFDVIDHIVLPLRRVGRTFIANLVQNIVEITDSIDDFADVGLLCR